MGKINLGRVIFAGLVAGIVSDILGYVVDGILLAPRWAAGMKALGHSEFVPNQWIWFNVLGLVGGIATIWIYAAIRPRFGAGATAAIRAGSFQRRIGWICMYASLLRGIPLRVVVDSGTAKGHWA